MIERKPLPDDRLAQVRERLHGRPLALGDQLYLDGELAQPGWLVLQEFRDDRAVLSEFGQHRQRRQQRLGAVTGYTMRNIERRRVACCASEMSPECFVWALVLIGEQSGEVEPAQARTTVWQLGQIYNGGWESMRWRDQRA